MDCLNGREFMCFTATKNHSSVPHAFQRKFRCDYCNSLLSGSCLIWYDIFGAIPQHDGFFLFFALFFYSLSPGTYGCGKFSRMGQSTSLHLVTHSSSRTERRTFWRFEHQWRICLFWYPYYCQPQVYTNTNTPDLNISSSTLQRVPLIMHFKENFNSNYKMLFVILR